MIRERAEAEERGGLVVTITFTNHNPGTIWTRLAAELGREPTHRAACDRVRAILRGAGEVKP